MPKHYRKKPVVIEAMELMGDREGFEAVAAWSGAFPVYTEDNLTERPPTWERKTPRYLIIHTLEGDHRADIGDFVIKGVKGEFYPCKPDIFWKTYEEA